MPAEQAEATLASWFFWLVFLSFCFEDFLICRSAASLDAFFRAAFLTLSSEGFVLEELVLAALSRELWPFPTLLVEPLCLPSSRARLGFFSSLCLSGRDFFSVGGLLRLRDPSFFFFGTCFSWERPRAGACLEEHRLVGAPAEAGMLEAEAHEEKSSNQSEQETATPSGKSKMPAQSLAHTRTTSCHRPCC